MSDPRPQRTYLPFLDVTRVLAVLGVVAIHVVGGGVSSGQVGLSVITLDMALVIAVPVFFMMAGALSLDPRAHHQGPLVFLRKRAIRIVPAMVVWSAFYIVVIRTMVSRHPVSVLDVLDLVVSGQTYTHLYFLFAIAGLYLVAPVLQAFLAGNEEVRAWVLGLVACLWTVGVMAIGQAGQMGVGHSVPLQAGTATFFLLYTGYFVLGRAFLVRPIPRWAAVVGLATVPGFIALVTWLYVASKRAAEDGTPDLWFSVLAPSYVSLPVVVYAIVLMASISSLCRGWRVSERMERLLRTVGNATFGIFLVHFAALVVLRELFPALSPYTPGAMVGAWALTVAVSTLLALVGQRIPLLRLIF
ncbi:acyltransferase [uncultured Brachybacterium sp.]|uniref:acyltransferase n=1 Tax=uncultured Brachybacterium sp. TaxID=189680 RepID=UPI0026033D1D|nr:acyltransferase family protein [uncultured Brachybacterium sp.]